MGDIGGNDNKRSRDEPADLPESKRLREILEDDDGVDLDDSVTDLDDVIRSLEEEIRDATGSELDLGFLLEASDDELGLLPAVGSQSSSSSLVDGADSVGVETGGSGFDRIWGFEDEGLGFGIDEDDKGIFGNGDLYDGGLFDCYRLDSGPLDYENLWNMDSK